MLKRSLLILGFCFSFSSTTHAAIINGDFQTCNSTGWQTDSATFGSPGFNTDFSVVNNGGNCALEIAIDLASTQEFVANTLFTELDLSVTAGFGLNLSFEWKFDGEETGLTSGRDNWFAAFNDGTGSYVDETGNLGSLFESAEYGAGTFSVDLDPAVFNLNNWSLEFQLLAGSDINFLGSLLSIDNVSLNTFALSNGSNAVTTPSTLGVLGLSVFGLAAIRRKRQA